MKKLLLTSRSYPDGYVSPSAFFRRTAGLLVFLCLSLASLYAQQSPTTTIRPSLTIRGRIMTEKGEPLYGATVRKKKDKRGTTTDSTGNFSLSVNAGDALAIS